jgi:hypothetical protein
MMIVLLPIEQLRAHVIVPIGKDVSSDIHPFAYCTLGGIQTLVDLWLNIFNNYARLSFYFYHAIYFNITVEYAGNVSSPSSNVDVLFESYTLIKVLIYVLQRERYFYIETLLSTKNSSSPYLL